MSSKGYRMNVGVCLFNQSGKVFVGERIDTPGAWQMPQGGLDGEEDVVKAALREMKEEVGTDSATLIRIHPEKLQYDFPPGFTHPIGKDYKGQIQTWVALRFTGSDSDIKLDADDHPEFSRYQWVDLAKTVDLIVPFKRETYSKVIKAFSDIK